MHDSTYSLFSVIGIELEYMIVDTKTLNVRPVSDQLLHALAGEMTNEIARGDIAISNELVMHVIELKTNGPKASLLTLDKAFHKQVKELNQQLKKQQACLMPSGAHPWLAPQDEIKLWPHGDRVIYDTYHRIFNCEGHGWSNLQSAHINLPFNGDQEFAQLHNAIRLVLPAIPALTASTPFLEGRVTGMVDSRLSFYGSNQAKIPQISGRIIPEFIISHADYDQHVLHPMYEAISPWDTAGVLQYEWLNSRAAIARFERSAIEIRIMDTQECPLADIACIAAIVGLLRYLVAETEVYLTQPLDCDPLRNLYDGAVKDGMASRFDLPEYWQQFGLERTQGTASEFWHAAIAKAADYIDSKYHATLEHIINHGNLAERLVRAVGTQVSRDGISNTYRQLCDCLAQNRLFSC